MDSNWDFKGWVTKYNVPCEDNRIIETGCFDRQIAIQVPLVIKENERDIYKCIGYAVLEPRDEGVYCYGYFFKNIDSPEINISKIMLQEGIVTKLGFCANKLKEELKEDGYNHVKCAQISFVYLCIGLFAVNPEARIEVIQI